MQALTLYILNFLVFSPTYVKDNDPFIHYFNACTVYYYKFNKGNNCRLLLNKVLKQYPKTFCGIVSSTVMQYAKHICMLKLESLETDLLEIHV